jgi:hypothetical protein
MALFASSFYIVSYCCQVASVPHRCRIRIPALSAAFVQPFQRDVLMKMP